VRILGIDPGRSEGERMVEYPPMQIKLAVTGHGHADKDDVLDAAMRELNLDTPPRPDDAADALAAALSLRLLQRRFGPLDMATIARIEALELSQLEDLSLSLLDFSAAADLQHWLEQLEA
jgi:Domain of unknown function (DUF4351)/Crossover junction endodeoxyribonuclease RuvC